MPKIPPVSWRKFEKFLLHIGCEFKRQRGSHRIYHKEGLPRPLVIPSERELSLVVIRSNLRTLGMSVEEFFRILKGIK